MGQQPASFPLADVSVLGLGKRGNTQNDTRLSQTYTEIGSVSEIKGGVLCPFFNVRHKA